jgi:potassium voltage-gated channel Shaker-related subfamily A protein 1
MCIYIIIKGQTIKKNSMSESSSDLMELEEGFLLKSSDVIKKPIYNPHYNNNIQLACMSIETDV